MPCQTIRSVFTWFEETHKFSFRDASFSDFKIEPERENFGKVKNIDGESQCGVYRENRRVPPRDFFNFYSERMATIGWTEAARRAGAKLATTATMTAIDAPAT